MWLICKVLRNDSKAYDDGNPRVSVANGPSSHHLFLTWSHTSMCGGYHVQYNTGAFILKIVTDYSDLT